MAGPNADILDRENWIAQFTDLSKAQPEDQICDTPVAGNAVVVKNPKEHDGNVPYDALSNRTLRGCQ